MHFLDPAEGDVIKAAHEDKDYIYPALEISDFDGNTVISHWNACRLVVSLNTLVGSGLL